MPAGPHLHCLTDSPEPLLVEGVWVQTSSLMIGHSCHRNATQTTRCRLAPNAGARPTERGAGRGGAGAAGKTFMVTSLTQSVSLQSREVLKQQRRACGGAVASGKGHKQEKVRIPKFLMI